MPGRSCTWPELGGVVRPASYARPTGDACGRALKGAVGRQRPSYSGNRDPWVFKPISFNGEWQSFPSGHLTHITAIAAAFAEEADRPWTTALGAGAVAFTGWQRLYRDQHWMSDVGGGMIIGTAASRLTAHWLRHHRQPTTAR
jgi:membrane-associated phospholipid phosphatase